MTCASPLSRALAFCAPFQRQPLALHPIGPSSFHPRNAGLPLALPLYASVSPRLSRWQPSRLDHLRCEQGRDDGLDGQRYTQRDSNCVHMQSPRLRVCTQAQLRCCKVCSAQVRQLEPLHIRYEAHSLGTSSASWSGRQLHTSPSISWYLGPKISAAGASSYTILRPVCHTLLVS